MWQRQLRKPEYHLLWQTVNDLSEDLYTAMVCSDFEAEGNKAVEWQKQALSDVKIVVLGGIPVLPHSLAVPRLLKKALPKTAGKSYSTRT